MITDNMNEQIEKIVNNCGNLVEKQNLNLQKINNLEKKMRNLQSFISRPDLPTDYANCDLEYKTSFDNYLRKGVMKDLVTKSYSSENAETGGAVVIPSLHHKIISKIATQSFMRGLANIVNISTNALDLVLEDGKLDSGWVGEAQDRPVTDNSTLKQKRILVHELYSQPKATQRLIDDAEIKIEDWIAERIADSFAKVENEAFIYGDGDKKPVGILHNDKLERIDCAAEITVESLLNLINALGEEYQQNATFLMNRVTLAKIQKLKDNNGRFVWQPSLTEAFKPTLFGIPIVCCSSMPKPENDKLAIAIGDFKAAYTIVDRSGINIMRDPYTEKPFVKFYAVKRVGGDVVNPDAIKIAKITA